MKSISWMYPGIIQTAEIASQSIWRFGGKYCETISLYSFVSPKAFLCSLKNVAKDVNISKKKIKKNITIIVYMIVFFYQVSKSSHILITDIMIFCTILVVSFRSGRSGRVSLKYNIISLAKLLRWKSSWLACEYECGEKTVYKLSWSPHLKDDEMKVAGPLLKQHRAITKGTTLKLVTEPIFLYINCKISNKIPSSARLSMGTIKAPIYFKQKR